MYAIFVFVLIKKQNFAYSGGRSIMLKNSDLMTIGAKIIKTLQAEMTKRIVG